MEETNNSIIPFTLFTSVRSYSHKLNTEAFSLLTTSKTNIFVDQVEEKSFILGCTNDRIPCETVEQFAPIAHLCFSNFIMALNIAALGHFTWNLEIFPNILYRFIDPNNNEDKIIALKIPRVREIDIRDITTNDVRRIFLLYEALCKEDNPNVGREYLKGILHLSFDFFDICFYKESFGNFYRSFEDFSLRIRGGKKLTNELKDLQKVMKGLGFGADIANEFEQLYILRGDQIMHAQKKQLEVEIDAVLKMKTVLDAVLHKFYQPVWERGMKDLEASGGTDADAKES